MKVNNIGYSGTPLSKELGIKPGFRVYIKNAPSDYLGIVTPLPEGVSILKRISHDLDMIHFFTKSEEELRLHLEDFSRRIKHDGMIWISWPKKASEVETDMTEDVIRNAALPLGLVDTKACTIDEVWSGLKLVTRGPE